MPISQSTISAMAARRPGALLAALTAALLVFAALAALDTVEHNRAVQEQRMHALERLSELRARLEGSLNVVLFSPLFPMLRRSSGMVVDFAGTSVSSLRSRRLLGETGLPGIEQTMLVAIRSLSANSRMIYGNPAVYAMDPVVEPVTLAGGQWEIAASPRTGWGAASQTVYILRLIGILCCLLAGSWVYGLVRQRQLQLEHQRHMVDSATQLKLRDDALNTAANAIIITDRSARIIWANQAFSKLTGYSQEETIGRHCGSLIKSGLHDQQFYENMWEAILSGRSWHGEIVNRRKDGSLYHDEMTITPVPSNDGQIGAFVALKQDISERKKTEAQVHRLAFYDALTQLPNRHLLQDRLGQVLKSCRRNSHHGALMFLDLDNFKSLNDRYGHNSGDLLLAEAARRISACVRAEDTVARFGGDEFVVLLELHRDHEVSRRQAVWVAEKIQAELAQSYRLPPGHLEETGVAIEHCCTSSIGIAMFANDEMSRETILAGADAAMYQAKAAGRNNIRFYNPP